VFDVGATPEGMEVGSVARMTCWPTTAFEVDAPEPLIAEVPQSITGVGINCAVVVAIAGLSGLL
jgi:hypothetical protein